MKAKELRIGQWYFCPSIRKRLKYRGKQNIHGATRHVFYEPDAEMMYTRRPQDVMPDNNKMEVTHGQTQDN